MSTPETGVVLIKVISASNLRAADKNGKSDPFVLISRKGKTRKQERTKVIKKSLSPTWDEIFKIKVTVEDTIVFSCMHRNQFISNVPLGYAEISVETIAHPSETAHNFSLELKEGNSAKLEIKIAFIAEANSVLSVRSLADVYFNNNASRIFRKPSYSNAKRVTYMNYVPEKGVYFRDIVTQESQWNSLTLNLLTPPLIQGWRALGAQLGMEPGDLDQLERTVQPSEVVKELLHEWQHGEFATADTILHALKAINNYTVFRDIISWLDASQSGTSIDETKELQMIASENVIKEEHVGEGSFAQVFKGTWYGVPVALKEISLKDKEILLKEARIITRCQSPNLVRFYGITQNPHAMVLEYMPGGTLYSLLHDEFEELPWEQRYDIAIGVARGVHYLHTNNIIHGNLTSLNVLLDEENRPKLADFGLTKTRESITKNLVGSSRWLAPEICRKESQHTKSSDVFSIGMILWELVSLEVPYSDQTDESVMEWVKQGHKESIPGDCPQQLKAAILNCWKEAAERPSAEVLYHYLWDATPEEPVLPKYQLADVLYTYLKEREPKTPEVPAAKPRLTEALFKSIQPPTREVPNAPSSVTKSQEPQKTGQAKSNGPTPALKVAKKWNMKLIIIIVSAIGIVILAVLVHLWTKSTPQKTLSFMDKVLGGR